MIPAVGANKAPLTSGLRFGSILRTSSLLRSLTSTPFNLLRSASSFKTSNCSSSVAIVKEPHCSNGTSSCFTSSGYLALPKALNLAFKLPGSGS